MRRILTAIGIGAAMSGAANANDGTYGKYETPSYDVVRTLGAAEIRNYEPHVLAEVAVRGDQRGALNSGFRALAGYIFGGNDTDASVAMTAPVTQSGDGDIWTVRFMMPRAYTLETLPAPNNDAVRFTQVPAKQMIALTFSGRTTTSVLADRTAELEAIVAAEGLQTTGTPVFMFYDDPFTLPWARRNEVALQVR